MKKILKKIITAVLRLEARLIVKKYNPRVIGVTGSVGKTSAKEAIYAALTNRTPAAQPTCAAETCVAVGSRIGKSYKSYNSEIGVPLALIGATTAWSSPWGWLKIILQGARLILRRDKNYPEIMVLEMGVDRPGDISKLEGIVRPHVAVLTAIGEVPVHVEFFAGPEGVAKEKSKILRHLGIDDFAILNFDDATVYDMHDKTRSKVLTFGFGEHADIRASNYQIMYEKGGDGGEMPLGISFKADHDGHSVPVRLYGAFGKQQVYAALAAIGVGIAEGMNLVEISEALSKYVSAPGRLKLVEGIKHTWLLDDTYNSSPQALHAALDTLADTPAKRRVAVLGDMLELGKYTIEAHQAVGRQVRKVADVLFTVGPRAKFIAREARELGMPHANIFEFSDSREAGPVLQNFMKEGDLVLIKGSQSTRMERVVEEVMAHPENAASLLVRQDAYWKK